MRVFLLSTFFMILLTGCITKMHLSNFKDGVTFEGQFNESNREVIVNMPNGEVLKGQYSAVSNATFSLTNINSSSTSYSGTMSAASQGTAMGTTFTSGGASQAYALLKSNESNLMMEIIVSYSDWTGHGFGEARTNDGRKFKVQF